MSERVYLLGEGPQDVEFMKRLLVGHFGLREVTAGAASPSVELAAWRDALSGARLRPRPARAAGAGAEAPMSSMRPPTFLHSTSLGTLVALSHAGGVDAIAVRLDADLAEIESLVGHLPTAVGIVVDGDGDVPKRVRDLARSLEEVDRRAPADIARVDAGPPRLGLYVLPGGGTGTKLETLLIEAARLMWPRLVQAAASYVGGRDAYGLELGDLKGFDAEKATTATIAAILAPKRQPMVALKESRWLDALADPNRTPALPQVAAFLEFLSALLATSPMTAAGLSP